MDVRMPDGTVIKNVPEGITKTQLLAKYQKYQQPPSMVMPPPAPSMLDEFSRGAGIVARGALPTMALGAAGGALAGPPGALAGSMMLPAAEALRAGANLALPQEYQIPSPSGAIENLMTQAGLPVPSSTTERALQAGGGAIAGAGAQIPALARMATSAITPMGRGLSETLAQAPGRQLAAAAPSAAAAQVATEEYQSPLAGMVAGAVVGAPFGMGVRQQAGPAREDLRAMATQSYDRARQMGIEIKPDAIASRMGQVEKGLRQKGYVTGVYPQIDAAFNQIKDTSRPKDFAELSALREIIASGQSATEPKTRMLASILKDEFDDYILNLPKSDIIGASSEQGAMAWRNAREQYSRLMKGEVFEKMLEDASFDVSKFTQSGKENALASALRNLAKNQKRMRTFTKEEQDAIRKAARGGVTQNILKFIGRFAPTGATSGTMYGTAALADPTFGLPTVMAAGTSAARLGAQSMRESSVQNLADMMRAGVVAPSPTSVAPLITAGRGAFTPVPGLLSQ